MESSFPTKTRVARQHCAGGKETEASKTEDNMLSPTTRRIDSKSSNPLLLNCTTTIFYKSFIDLRQNLAAVEFDLFKFKDVTSFSCSLN